MKKKKARAAYRAGSSHPFVLATSHPNPNGVKAAEVSALYASPKATWADGSPLRIILRPKSDSDTPVLSGMFAGMPSSMETARTRQDVLIAATDQDNAKSRRADRRIVDRIHPHATSNREAKRARASNRWRAAIGGDAGERGLAS